MAMDFSSQLYEKGVILADEASTGTSSIPPTKRSKMNSTIEREVLSDDDS